MDAFPRMLVCRLTSIITAAAVAVGAPSIITALSFLELGLAKYIVIAGSRED